MTKIAERSSDRGSLGTRGNGTTAKLAIRQLTKEEIETLEGALGQYIDRKYLVHWMSHSIGALVQFSSLPSARELRDDLHRIAREGRQWIRHVAAYPNIFPPAGRMQRDALITAGEAFCAGIDYLVAQATPSIKAGRRKTHPAFQAFLDNMIGIAKKARIRPSTPQRTRPPPKKKRIKGHLVKSAARQPPPPFFQFVQEALTISLEVINTSSLSKAQKAEAVSILPKTEEALIKAIENKRGGARAYKAGAFGLIEG
jgi:hypothetical protein